MIELLGDYNCYLYINECWKLSAVQAASMVRESMTFQSINLFMSWESLHVLFFAEYYYIYLILTRLKDFCNADIFILYF